MTFEEYVTARGPALVRLARLLTGDEHRAEDLVQEVLGRLRAHLPAAELAFPRLASEGRKEA